MPPDMVRTFHDSGNGYGFTGFNPCSDFGQFWPSFIVYQFYEHLEDPAAGEADREGVVVADPVMLEARSSVRENLGSYLKKCTLDTTTTDTANCFAVGGHQH